MAPIALSDIPENGRVLSVRKSLMAMLGLCFVTMLVAIDQTVVGTALPTIVAELNGFELYAWVATSYLLTSIITIPIFGRLGDYYGRKPFVVASVIVFTLASMLCGMADSMLQLVLARALQGIGGGMLVGTAWASVPDLFPDSRVRLRWQVLLSAAFGISNAVGPSLGGFLTQHAGWRSVFYVNVPIGVLSLFFIWRCLPHIRSQRMGRIHLDWQGALLLALGLGSLQLFVEFLPMYGASLPMVALGITGLAVFVGLYHWEKRCPEPLLPLDMFRNRGLAALFLLSVFTGVVMFALLFYAPLLLQGGFGLTPQETGMLITPLVVCITVGSISNGRIITRLSNPNYMLYAGFIMLTLCLTGLVTTHQQTSRWLLISYMAIGGTGLGFVMPNLTVFAQEAAGRSLLGIATAMLQSMRMIGGMLGTALVGTMINHFYASGVRASLASASPNAWAHLLEDPQVLVNNKLQSDFILQLQRLSLNGDAFIEAARMALVSAIHSGLLTALAFTLLAVIWVSRVPAPSFTPLASREKQA
jgi:EmrB/QacA subfamily drug resistance transporter